jgi:energy-coupling factor transporter ATPase
VEDDRVSISEVTYTYPRQSSPTLREVNLHVQTGGVLAVMGPTGAGKTTLVSLLNGLIPQYFEGLIRGQVIVSSFSTYEHSIQRLVEHVGMVLQDPETQIFGITVLEDTAFGPSNLGYPRPEILARVTEALANVRLAGYESRMTSYLSGGEKQRLAIAGVLAMQPEILVLDEPTSELDPRGRAEVLEAVDHLRDDKQTTVVFVDHEAEEVLRLADQVAVLIEGQIVWSGEPSQLFRDVPMTTGFAIRPPQMAELGYELSQRRLITPDEIPLTVQDAESLVRRLLKGRSFSLSAQVSESLPAAQRPPIIEVKDLTHTYEGGIQALSGISLTVGQGEFVAIVGQNGAGKSTLVKHLNGLLKPTSGKVTINGLDTRQHDVRELSRQVGYVFQNPDHQIFCSTVAEEIGYGLKSLGLSEAEQQERISEALDIVDLGEKRDQHPFSLGKGERQKVAVASILAIAPPVMVIDEPTTGLDWRGAVRMMELIRSLHEQGHTIIMITHSMKIVAEYAERVVLLNQGRVMMDANPSGIFEDLSALRKAYLESPSIILLARKLADLGCPTNILTVAQMVRAIAHTLENGVEHV